MSFDPEKSAPFLPVDIRVVTGQAISDPQGYAKAVKIASQFDFPDWEEIRDSLDDRQLHNGVVLARLAFVRRNQIDSFNDALGSDENPEIQQLISQMAALDTFTDGESAEDSGNEPEIALN